MNKLYKLTKTNPISHFISHIFPYCANPCLKILWKSVLKPPQRRTRSQHNHSRDKNLGKVAKTGQKYLGKVAKIGQKHLGKVANS